MNTAQYSGLLLSSAEIADQFCAWQQALVEMSKKIGARTYNLDGNDQIYFKFSKAKIGPAHSIVTFANNEQFNPAIVKINVPRTADSTNGLSHVLIDNDVKIIIRQGRLHHNPTNPQNILPDQFDAVCEADPVFKSQLGKKAPRNWFQVCELRGTSEEICAQTVAFVIMCKEVREALARAPQDEPQPKHFRWIADELILALSLYLNHGGSPPNQYSLETISLSNELRVLGSLMGRRRRANYRSPSSVYMKAMNFRRLDPKFINSGTVGLKNGSQAEQRIWDLYGNKPEELGQIASAIRAAIASQELLQITIADEDYDAAEGVEGRVLVGLHRSKERDRAIVEKKKRHAIKKYGCLRCEGCRIVFGEKYGAHGDGFIEAHHLFPVRDMLPNHRTKIGDLALLCANCHRMVHKRVPWLTIHELKDIVVAQL
ncbi:HNH endonuclease [Agrobacterium larrymoorei]|uniref:HNH endonuclease n=1 Tax=Agrobacterium larrymoorei TaxID=160699 RepID=UPI0030C2EAC3